MNTTHNQPNQPRSFSMDGWTYYQQSRRCSSRRSCITCEAGGEHGPYWYRRSPHQRDVQYLGVELPTTITEAYTRVQLAKAGLAQAIRSRKAHSAALESEVAALEALANNDLLSDQHRSTIAGCGFEEALPPVIHIESKRKKQNQPAEHQRELLPLAS